MSLDSVKITCIEKTATDNGFDLARGRDGDWLIFGSSQASLQLWLTAPGDSRFLVALSRADIFDALSAMGDKVDAPIPKGAVAALGANGLSTLHRIIRRAFQLARALPDEPLQAFLARTASLPRTTEAERLVVQRVGQEVFRDRLLDYWESRCAITGLAVPALLRASHIKPWADCESDAERLDVFNGLLLAPHLDAAFDRGFITVSEEGEVMVAGTLDQGARRLLGLDQPLLVRDLTDRHRRYLPWHRERVFRKGF